MSFLFLFCSKDDNNIKEPCFMFFVFVSDDCDCTIDEWNCGNFYVISETEYNKILDIQNNSNDLCPYINFKEIVSGDNFEGNLISLSKSPCPVIF